MCKSMHLWVGTCLQGASCHFKYLQQEAKHWSIKHDPSLVVSEDEPVSTKVSRLNARFTYRQQGYIVIQCYCSMPCPKIPHKTNSRAVSWYGGSQFTSEWMILFESFIALKLYFVPNKDIWLITEISTFSMSATSWWWRPYGGLPSKETGTRVELGSNPISV